MFEKRLQTNPRSQILENKSFRIRVQNRQIHSNDAERSLRAEILAEVRNAEKRLSSNLEIEALVAGLKAGKQVKQLNKDVEADNRIRAVTTLQQVVYGVRERNRLEGHSNYVYSVAMPRWQDHCNSQL